MTQHAAPPGSGTPSATRPAEQGLSTAAAEKRPPSRQPVSRSPRCRAGSGRLGPRPRASREQPFPRSRYTAAKKRLPAPPRGQRRAAVPAPFPAPHRPPPLTRGAAAEPAPRCKDVPGLPQGRARRIRTRRRRALPMAPRWDDSKRPISARRSAGAKARPKGGCCFRDRIGAAGRGKLRMRRASTWFEDLVGGVDRPPSAGGRFSISEGFLPKG